jgi:cytochrome d ubiquinol oxidase subunit I
MYRKATRFGAIVALVASIGVMVSGDIQGKVMTEVQPMKMAAAEGLYETRSGAPFSSSPIGSLDGTGGDPIIEVPGLLSFLGTGSFSGEIKGINDASGGREGWLTRSPAVRPRGPAPPRRRPTPR